MSAQLALDLGENAPKTVATAGLRKGSPGPERLLAALVRRGLAEEHLHAAATIALLLDEDAGR